MTFHDTTDSGAPADDDDFDVDALEAETEERRRVTAAAAAARRSHRHDDDDARRAIARIALAAAADDDDDARIRPSLRSVKHKIKFQI